jgi:uncharacterized protein YodC (DUF2158 family)
VKQINFPSLGGRQRAIPFNNNPNLCPMPKSKFKIGDGVQLFSGSPHMTIIKKAKNGQVECCWFDRDDKERRSIYPQAALVAEKVDALSDEDLKRRLSQATRCSRANLGP